MPVIESPRHAPHADADTLRSEYLRLADAYPAIRDRHERTHAYRRLMGLLEELREVEGYCGPWHGLTSVAPPWV